MKINISKSLEDTSKLAKEVLANLDNKKVLLLQGDLGSGKTTFAKAVAQHLGVEDVVTSPTFSLMKVYKTKYKQFNRLVHVDLYRLDSVDIDQLVELGLQEFIDDSKSLVLIEWPERLEEDLQDTIQINFKIINNKEREMVVR